MFMGLDAIEVMIRNNIYSKPAIITTICDNDYFLKGFELLKAVDFPGLKFDYKDIDNILYSNLNKEYKDKLIRYLVLHGKTCMNSLLYNVFKKHNLLVNPVLPKSIIISEECTKKKIINGLRISSFFNIDIESKINERFKRKYIKKYDLSILYWHKYKEFYLQDFIGNSLELIIYLIKRKASLKTIFSTYRFILQCKYSNK